MMLPRETHEVKLNAKNVKITSRGSLREIAIDGIHYDSISQAACNMYDPYDEYYLLDLVISMNIENVSNHTKLIKNIIQNKSLYDKKQLFEELLNILFNDSSAKSLERLRVLKDIIVKK